MSAALFLIAPEAWNCKGSQIISCHWSVLQHGIRWLVAHFVWRNLPESRLCDSLLTDAWHRVSNTDYREQSPTANHTSFCVSLDDRTDVAHVEWSVPLTTEHLWHCFKMVVGWIRPGRFAGLKLLISVRSWERYFPAWHYWPRSAVIIGLRCDSTSACFVSGRVLVEYLFNMQWLFVMKACILFYIGICFINI